MTVTLEEIAEKQEEQQKTFHQFKEDHDKFLEAHAKDEGTAEYREKTDKQLEEITKVMKETQEFDA